MFQVIHTEFIQSVLIPPSLSELPISLTQNFKNCKKKVVLKLFIEAACQNCGCTSKILVKELIFRKAASHVLAINYLRGLFLYFNYSFPYIKLRCRAPFFQNISHWKLSSPFIFFSYKPRTQCIYQRLKVFINWVNWLNM